MNKKQKIAVADSLLSAAGVLGVPISTIREAKRRGCPAFQNGRVDIAELRSWARRNTFSLKAPPPPPAPMAELAEAIADTDGNSVELLEGAAYTLTRLATQEKRLYQQLVKTPDPITAAVLRKEWMAVSEQLRKADASLEEHRRAVGELVQREVVERALNYLLGALYSSLKSVGMGAAEKVCCMQQDPPSVLAIIDDLAMNAGTQAITFVRQGVNGGYIPTWLADSLKIGWEKNRGDVHTVHWNDKLYENYHHYLWMDGERIATQAAGWIASKRLAEKAQNEFWFKKQAERAKKPAVAS
jgi:hypothetical protein